MAQTMRDNGITDVLLNPLATTIYFPQPSQELLQLHHLAPDEEGFCHAIIANHTLGEFGGYGTADLFLNNLLEERRGQQG